MNNKKMFIGIIAILLLIGTGSFVFANQNNNESDLENDINYRVNDGTNSSNNNSSNNSTNDKNSNVDSNNENTNSNINDILNGENNSNSSLNNGGTNNNSNTNGSSSNNNSNGNNSNSNNNNNNNNQNNLQNKPTLPENISDTTAPKASSSVEYTDNNIVVTITSNEEIKYIDTWTLSDDKKTLIKIFAKDTEPKEYSITVEDLAGNGTEVKYTIEDKIAPIANASVEYTDNNIVVTISSNEKIKEVEGWKLKGNVLTKILPKDTEANEYSVKIEDLVGNGIEVKYIIEDRIAPSLSIDYSTTALTRNSVTATITSNEDIKAIEGWTLNGRVLTKEFSSNASGSVIVSDLAGNTSTIPYSISNIDTTAPTATVDVTKNGDNATVTITANENIRTVEGWTLNGRVLTKEFKEFTSGTYSLTIYDLAGNTATVSYILIDDKPPVLELTYSTEELTKDPVIVTIKANKPIKEVEGWTLSNDKLVLTKEFTTNTSGEVTACDEENHCSEPITYEIKNIDNEAPTAIVTTSNNNGYKSTFRDISVTITASEEVKEIEGWTLSEDKKVLTKTFKENKNDILTIYDLAGNEAKVNYEIKNYNPNRPEITVDKGESETTVTMVYSEPLDDTWQLNDNGEYTKVVVLPNDGEISITDNDGNVIVINSSLTPSLTVNISNKNEDGSYSKTNKVEVTIVSDKELQEIEGWTLSEDMKTLTKNFNYNEMNGKIVVRDLFGNSTTAIYSVRNVDTTLPDLLAAFPIVNNGKVTVTLVTSEQTLFYGEGWDASRINGYAQKYTKTYEEENIKLGVQETFELKDLAGNEATVIAVLKYTNGKIAIEKK